MHLGRHSLDHLLTCSLLRLFIGWFICCTNQAYPSSIIGFSSLFSVKGQGDGEQPNQPGVEDNEQHGGEGGKS